MHIDQTKLSLHCPANDESSVVAANSRSTAIFMAFCATEADDTDALAGWRRDALEATRATANLDDA